MNSNLNNSNLNGAAVWFLCVNAVLISVSGCYTAQNSTLQALEGVTQKDSTGSPFVEAFVELVGPDRKWAGPAPILVHLNSRDPRHSEVTATPAWFGAEPSAPPVPPSLHEEKGPASNPFAGGRLAQQQIPTRAPASFSGDPTRSAVEALGKFGTSEADAPGEGISPKGCLSTVRLRLVREDGTVVSREACRGSSGWSGQVLRTVAGLFPASR